MVNLSVPPQPFAALSTTACLQAPEKRGFPTRRIPEIPRDDAGAMPVRVLVRPLVPQINMPAKTVNGLAAHTAESGAACIGALSIGRRRGSKGDR